jgi:long-chain fatty acid transport protein
VGVDLFMPEREMDRTMGGMTLHEAKSDKEQFWIPEFGINHVIDNQISIGLTVYGNGGMNTTYAAQPAMCTPNSFAISQGRNALCGEGRLGVNLEQLIFAPTAAYKINADHAVGVSPLLVYQTFKAYGLHAFQGLTASQTADKLTNQGRDSSTGVGVRLGYLGKISNSISIGASYSPKINMSRFSKYEELFAQSGDFDIPANYALGIAMQLSPVLQVMLDYQRIDYGGVKSISNSSSNQSSLGSENGPGFGWDDVGVVKLGVQWQANSDWTVRAGYSKGDNPVSGSDVSFNIVAPGVIEEHYTLGATMKLDAASEVSASYMHAVENSVTGLGNGGVTETIKMKQNSLGIQYSRKF